MPKRTGEGRSPADGERSSAGGYFAQYIVAASLIYDRLLAGELDFIRVSDPRAEKADDIVIGSSGRLDAYQVKWAATPGLYPFNSLTYERPGRPNSSLVFGLATGWKQLSADHPHLRVRVHLISNEYPSNRAKVPARPGMSAPTFAEFVRGNALDCSKRPEADPIFETAIETLRQKSGLGDEFEHFWAALTCHFGFQDPIRGANTQLGRRSIDIRQLSQFLFETTANPTKKVTINRAELLEQLKWTDRFRPRFRHEFPVSELLYRPIEGTVAALTALVDKFDRGYIALLGSPGAGKSTTLTKTFRYQQNLRVFKYYAYVRNDPAQGRGEASQLWHDLYLMLIGAGIHPVEEHGRTLPATSEEFKIAFFSQLAALGEQWKERGIKTVILIDGLDHIQREQNPTKSLVSELPAPDSLPEGVLIVCGSQTLSLEGLSPRILAHLEVDGRTIQIQRLARESVFSIVDAAKVGQVNGESTHDEIFTISDGHPLALSYLLERLIAAPDDNGRKAVLTSAEPFRGNIEQDYQTFWISIRSAQTKELCALICRLREGVDMRLLRGICAPVAIEEFAREAQHFFEKPGQHYWRFFHNSFKQFLIRVSRENVVGADANERELELQKLLVTLCKRADSSSPLRWELLYHQYQAKDYQSVTQLGTQSYFRSQFMSSRPIGLIRDDIDLLLKSAANIDQGISILRGWFIEHELSERTEALDGHNLASHVFRLSGVDEALGLVFNHDELRISDEDALELCLDMAKSGELDAASALFEKCEPLNLLTGADALQNYRRGESTLLNRWCDVAHYFRKPEQILKAIRSIRIESNEFEVREDVEAEEQSEYVWRVAMALIERDDQASYDAFVSALEGSESFSHLRPHIARRYVISPSGRINVERELDIALSAFDAEYEYPATNIALAEAELRIRGMSTLANQVLERIKQPPIAELGNDFLGKKGLVPFQLRIRLNQLLSVLNKAEAPEIAVPNMNDERREAAVLFERMLVLIANIWGQANRGDVISGGAIVHSLQPALRLFHRNIDRSPHSWHHYLSSRREYFEFIIKAVACHGIDCISALGVELESYWQSEELRKYWPYSLMRSLSLEFWRQGDARENLTRRLTFISTIQSKYEGPSELVESHLAQAIAWTYAGNQNAARSEFDIALASSFGVYHDGDSQILEWARWLLRVGKVDPKIAADKIEKFITAIVALANGHRGSGVQEAATTIIRVGFAISPRLGDCIRQTLLDKRSLEHCSGIEGLILGILDRSPLNFHLAVPLTACQLVPFNASLRTEVGSALMRAANKAQQSDLAPAFVNFFSEIVNTKEFPGNRAGWFKGMLEHATDNDSIELLTECIGQSPEEAGHTSDNPLILNDGESLSEEAIVSRVKSFDDLRDLIQKTKKVSYLPWDRILKDKLNSMTTDELLQIPNLLNGIGSPRTLFATIGKLLFERGDIAAAEIAAEEAFRRSEPGGWMKRFDGGSRIEAAKELLKISQDRWRGRLQKSLVEDYISSYRQARDRIMDLEPFLPFLFQGIPHKEIWKEIEEHFLELNEFSQHQPVPLLPTNGGDLSDCKVVVDTVIDLMGSPVSEIAGEAQICLLDILSTDFQFEAVQCLIIKIEYDEKSDRLAYLLDALNLSISRLSVDLSRAVPMLHTLAEHDDVGIQRLAWNVLMRLDEGSVQKSNKKRELPTIYQIKLPPLATSDRTITASMIVPGEPLPDLGDAFEMIAPFNSEAAQVAKDASIPLENILERVLQVMRNLSSQDNWNAKAEVGVRSQLNSLDLKLPFRRPRTTLAYRAIRHVIGELIAGGRLHRSSFSVTLMSRIGDAFIVRPDLRPSFLELTIPSERAECEEWIKRENMRSSKFAHQQKSELGVILGETTIMVDYSWSSAEEKRSSAICFPTSVPIGGVEIPNGMSDVTIESYRTWYASDYPTSLNPPPSPSAVIRGQPLLSITCNDEWLAVNPAVCRALEWIQDYDELFGWRDSDGRLMVRSVFWQDGPIGRPVPRVNTQCGSGWLVIASPHAFKMICDRFEPTKRRISIKRAYRDDNKEFTNAEKYEEELN